MAKNRNTKRIDEIIDEVWEMKDGWPRKKGGLRSFCEIHLKEMIAYYKVIINIKQQKH